MHLSCVFTALCRPFGDKVLCGQIKYDIGIFNIIYTLHILNYICPVPHVKVILQSHNDEDMWT
jgi:hypothetical protein